VEIITLFSLSTFKILPLLCFAVKSGVTCELCELFVGYAYKLVDSKTEVRFAII